jgi:hypothetical protein
MQHKENAVLHNYFQQKNMNPLSESIEKPVKELMDLNVKALQSLTYLTPTELLKMRRPEEVIEKNMQIFIDNSNTALDYLHNMFNIMERHWLKNANGMLKNTEEQAKQAMHTVSTQTKGGAKKSASKAAKSVATHAKTSTIKSKSSTGKSSTANKQPLKHTATTTHKDSKTVAKPHTVTSEVKHVSSGAPHVTSASHIKPIDKK